MRHYLALMIVASATIASACSTVADLPKVELKAQVTATVPASARVACAEPVPLPDRRLSEAETGDKWGKDRDALRICEKRRAAAVSAIEHDPMSGGVP